MGFWRTQTGTGHDSFWLRLIGAGKVLKGIFLLLIAVSVLRLVHTGFGDEMASIADLMRYSPESKILHWLFEKASLLNDKRLVQLSIIAAVYALTEFVESYGLLLRRMWGEYLTFTLTCAFLPLDIYEVVFHFTWIKFGFTIVNGLVAWYLGWLIRRNRMLLHHPSAY
jgi:uncharacterized membrane protein (DUF2068 family)